MGRLGGKKKKTSFYNLHSSRHFEANVLMSTEAHEVVTSDWVLKIDSINFKAGSVFWLACKNPIWLKMSTEVIRVSLAYVREMLLDPMAPLHSLNISSNYISNVVDEEHFVCHRPTN